MDKRKVMNSSQNLESLTNKKLISISDAIANEILIINEKLNGSIDLPLARKGLMREFYRYQKEIEKRNIGW